MTLWPNHVQSEVVALLHRAILIQMILVPVAILNGMVRESILKARGGEQEAHWLSTITMCSAILVVVWLAVP